jgi:hypothetical protein
MIDERTHGLRPWRFDHNGNDFMDNAERDVNDTMRSNRVGFVAIGGGAEVKHNNVFNVSINLTVSGEPSLAAKETVRELIAELKSLTGQPIVTPKKSFWSREK